MAIGKVKWFNNEKKYGFILIDDREVFVHFSSILKEGYKTLKKGQRVECDIVKGPKGERAVNVREQLTAPVLPRTEILKKRQGLFLRHSFQTKRAEPHE